MTDMFWIKDGPGRPRKGAVGLDLRHKDQMLGVGRKRAIYRQLVESEDEILRRAILAGHDVPLAALIRGNKDRFKEAHALNEALLEHVIETGIREGWEPLS